jgi:DNA-binding NarL/FixJ family response regulator
MHDPTSKNQRSSIRVFIFAEFRIVIECLEKLIGSHRDMTVSAAMTINSANDAKITKFGDRSDVAVICLSQLDQVQIIAKLIDSNPNIRVVVVTDENDLDLQAKALELGAVGIVQKNQNHKFLLEAIRQTFIGETWLNQVLLHRIINNRKSSGKSGINSLALADADGLTARELEVVQLIGEGLNNKAIAKRLDISEATVRHHLSSIYSKTGTDDRVNMVILAHENGLIDLVEPRAHFQGINSQP